MKRSLLVVAAILITATTARAQDRLVSLMEKFDKRMDVLDAKIQMLEDRLKALEGKYTTPNYVAPAASPKPSYTPSYSPQPAFANMPKMHKMPKQGALPPGFFEIEQDGEIIVIGPPPWAFPNGPPPGLIPIGPHPGPPPGFMANR